MYLYIFNPKKGYSFQNLNLGFLLKILTYFDPWKIEDLTKSKHFLFHRKKHLAQNADLTTVSPWEMFCNSISDFNPKVRHLKSVCSLNYLSHIFEKFWLKLSITLKTYHKRQWTKLYSNRASIYFINNSVLQFNAVNKL